MRRHRHVTQIDNDASLLARVINRISALERIGHVHDGSAGGAGLHVGTTAPADPDVEPLWFNTDYNQLYVWAGGAWRNTSTDEILSAVGALDARLDALEATQEPWTAWADLPLTADWTPWDVGSPTSNRRPLYRRSSTPGGGGVLQLSGIVRRVNTAATATGNYPIANLAALGAYPGLRYGVAMTSVGVGSLVASGNLLQLQVSSLSPGVAVGQFVSLDGVNWRIQDP